MQSIILCRNFLPRVGKSHIRMLSAKVPFDIDDVDEKYKDFTTMYSEMFTQGSGPNHKPEATGDDKKSELEQLDSEMNELYNVSFPILTPIQLEKKVKSSGQFIIQSLSDNPFYNLALEDYIFKNTPVDQNELKAKFPNKRLLFYINRKCAVIGKNQTIWQELYLNELRKRDYMILRRFSGGGAVIHDSGNVNYSFLTSRDEFKTTYFNQLIRDWLHTYSHDGLYHLNKRGDILYDDKKCSGSAYKISRGKAYHHGTMLVKSNLKEFKGLLKPKNQNGITWTGHGVDSVRSNITNIPLHSPQLFIDICTEGFRQTFGSNIPVYYCDNKTINEEIQQIMRTLQSDKWKYNNSPKFSVYLEASNEMMTIEKGMIIESKDSSLIGKEFASIYDNNPLFESTR